MQSFIAKKVNQKIAYKDMQAIQQQGEGEIHLSTAMDKTPSQGSDYVV